MFVRVPIGISKEVFRYYLRAFVNKIHYACVAVAAAAAFGWIYFFIPCASFISKWEEKTHISIRAHISVQYCVRRHFDSNSAHNYQIIELVDVVCVLPFICRSSSSSSSFLPLCIRTNSFWVVKFRIIAIVRMCFIFCSLSIAAADTFATNSNGVLQERSCYNVRYAQGYAGCLTSDTLQS